jgi:glycosyltransferase involved in cell wall biosynthesis
MSRLQGERLIVIGPTPPPIHGIAVFTELLLRQLQGIDRLAAHLDTTDERPLDNLGRLDVTNVRLGIGQAVRLIRLLAVHREAAVYLPLAPTRWGFVRDAVLIAIARLWRRRVYVHLHGGSGLEGLYATAGPVMRWLIRATTSAVHRAWALTPSLAASSSALFPAGRVEVLENVVEDPLLQIARSSAMPPPRPEANGEFRVLYLSHLLPEKGCFDLLDAVDRLGPRADGWHVRIVGAALADSVRGMMLERATGLRDRVLVELPGEIRGEAKARLFQWADVFVLPSRYPFGEGQPLALLEALAAGLPIVSTSHSGIPDTVRDRREGLLVPPGDTDALAGALSELAADPGLRSALGRRARRRYEGRYAPSRLDRDLLRLLGPSEQAP